MSPRRKSTLHPACIISALFTLDVLTLGAVRLCQFKFAQHYKPKLHTYRLQMSVFQRTEYPARSFCASVERCALLTQIHAYRFTDTKHSHAFRTLH